MSFHVPEQFRLATGRYASTAADGNNGAFAVRLRGNQPVQVIASDGGEWEHVSVSRSDRVPTWGEMCQTKDLFWDAEDCVMQLHPPRSQYVNVHAHCLHLWRPTAARIPLPPKMMV